MGNSNQHEELQIIEAYYLEIQQDESGQVQEKKDPEDPTLIFKRELGRLLKEIQIEGELWIYKNDTEEASIKKVLLMSMQHLAEQVLNGQSIFVAKSTSEKDSRFLKAQMMAKLNELNRQYFWKDGEDIWNALDDLDCILIQAQHPLVHHIPLLSKIGFVVLVSVDKEMTLKSPDNEEFEMKADEKNDRTERRRPEGSSKNSGQD